MNTPSSPLANPQAELDWLLNLELSVLHEISVSLRHELAEQTLSNREMLNNIKAINHIRRLRQRIQAVRAGFSGVVNSKQ